MTTRAIVAPIAPWVGVVVALLFALHDRFELVENRLLILVGFAVAVAGIALIRLVRPAADLDSPVLRGVSAQGRAREVLGLLRADFQHRGQLDQLGLMLVGVVLAEQQLGPGRKLRAHASSSAAPIAAISPGQFGTGQSCVHGASVSYSRMPRAYLLSQTYSVPALFPGGFTGVSCLTLSPCCGTGRLAL